MILSGGIRKRQGYQAVQYQYLNMCRAVNASPQTWNLINYFYFLSLHESHVNR